MPLGSPPLPPPLLGQKPMNSCDQDFSLPPFPCFPTASRFVAVGSVADAFARVQRSIQAFEPFSTVIGPPGTGKSLLCELVAEHFTPQMNVISLGDTSLATTDAFLQRILHAFNAHQSIDETMHLELQVHDALVGRNANGKPNLLIIDEADDLSVQTLEAIRRLSNLRRAGHPMLSALLAGGHRLEETLIEPALEGFVQRIGARCYLHPLEAQEVRQYIYQSISNCHASPEETISEKAVHAVTHATGGIARLINQLMTEAIDCAAEEELTKISHQVVEKAWSRLQQLPGPIIDEPEMSSPVTNIEFGTDLDDLDNLDHSASDEADMAPVFDNPESTWMPPAPIEETETQESAVLETPPVKAIDPAELFGRFEIEEAIEVSHVASSQTKRTPETAPQQSEPEQSEPEQHVEEAEEWETEFGTLASAETTETSAGSIDTLTNEPMLAMAHDIEASPVQEDAVAQETVPARETATRQDTVVWMDESHPISAPAFPTSKPNLETESSEANSPKLEVVRADDTDLLWVTESVEVEQRTPAGSVQDSTPNDQQNAIEKLQFDHREILQRMRG